MENRIEIQLSKTKLIWLFIGSMAFVLVGFFFLIEPNRFVSPIFTSDNVIFVTGMVGIAFFGLCAIYVFIKLFDKKAGLIIDEKGITDNTNGTSIGLIEWDDISGVDVVKIGSTKILLLQTSNPEKFIAKATNRFSKKTMQVNHKLYGTPISIISGSLEIKFNDMEKLVRSELHKREVQDEVN